MLLELRVENYAVIDNVVVEFAAGLNLLTGETGAGKSILIDALALLLGEKASSEIVAMAPTKPSLRGFLTWTRAPPPPSWRRMAWMPRVAS